MRSRSSRRKPGLAKLLLAGVTIALVLLRWGMSAALAATADAHRGDTQSACPARPQERRPKEPVALTPRLILA
jgi:hypothetical protein